MTPGRRLSALWLALATLAAAAIAAGPTATHAAEIRVLASMAVKEIVVEGAKLFGRSSGHTVFTTWGGTEAITRRIRDGEVTDVVIVAAPNVDALVADGRLAAGSRVDIARSGIGVAVRAGLPRPDISSGDAVRRAVLAARSIAYSSGPSGFHVAGLFRALGITDEIRDKVRQTPSGVQVADVVARGEADLGFQQISELIHAKGIEYVGPLPAEIQHITTFAAAVHAAAATPDAARALIDFFASRDADAIVRAAGMEPPPRREPK